MAHVFYLQYILGLPSVSDVYWTLTYEIQFYLLLAMLLAIAQRLGRRVSSQTAFWIAFGPVLLYGALVGRRLLPAFRGACIADWGAFFTGVAAQRFVTRGERVALVVAMAAAPIAFGASSVALTVAATGGAIAAGHLLGRLDVWLTSPAFRWLGRISYSFYLVHWLIGGRLANLVEHGLRHTTLSALAVTMLSASVGMGAALTFAQLFWWLIERPSLALSRSVGSARATPIYSRA